MKTYAMALISIAAFMAASFGVGLLVTGPLQESIEFSLFVGIPVGLLAGVAAFVACFVLLLRRERRNAPQQAEE